MAKLPKIIQKYVNGFKAVNRLISHGFRFKFYFLLIIAFLSALLENFGFALIVPLVETITQGDFSNPISLMIKPVLVLFPKEYWLITIVGLVAGLMVMKSITVLLRERLSLSLRWNICIASLKIGTFLFNN